eukprot:scaffold65696_cov34-Phaeocystis_antarctica.AAC.1
MEPTNEQLAEDPAYQEWLRKKLVEQAGAGSVAEISLPAGVPGASAGVAADTQAAPPPPPAGNSPASTSASALGSA